jgi:hypothetical protein
MWYRILSFIIILITITTEYTFCEDTIGIDIHSKLEMIKIEANSFIMGTNSPNKNIGFEIDSVPAHNVKIATFYVSSTLIKWGLFLQCIKETKFRTQEISDPFYGDISRTVSDVNGPIIFISWNQCIVFCNWLSEKENLENAYIINYDGEGIIKNVTWNKKANGYRLLTEAEFEYIYTEGGKNSKQLSTSYLWGKTSGKIGAVDSYPPNTFLIKFIRPVSEFTWNIYEKYTSKEQIDPTGPVSNENNFLSLYRVRRGWGQGSFIGRWETDPNRIIEDFISFRVARSSI